jgi:hypothetical protein
MRDTANRAIKASTVDRRFVVSTDGRLVSMTEDDVKQHMGRILRPNANINGDGVYILSAEEVVAIKDNPPWLKAKNTWVATTRKVYRIDKMARHYLESSLAFMEKLLKTEAGNYTPGHLYNVRRKFDELENELNRRRKDMDELLN